MNSLSIKRVSISRWIPFLLFAQLIITPMITSLTFAYGAGAIEIICGALYQPFANLIQNKNQERQVNDLNDLLNGFSQGLEPNPSDPSQWAAFELYRRMRLGDPITEISPDHKDQMRDILKKYPSLKKEPFRNYELQTQVRIYPVTPELKKFISSQLKIISQIKSNLIQIDANLGYWKNILQYDRSNKEFLNYLYEKIPKSFREKLAKKEVSANEGSQILFSYLKKEHLELQKRGKDIRLISQAIVNLIHSFFSTNRITE